MIDMEGLPTDLEEEALKARGIAETMKILYAASCGGRAAGVNFGDISTSLFLLCQMFEDHTNRLETFAHTAYSIERK